jgi:hypothetical protein
MINNVLRLSDYRQPLQSAADPPRDLEELAAMSYDAASIGRAQTFNA